MKRYILYSILLVFACGIRSSFAQTPEHRDRWYIPDFVVAQYAGSIGFVSAGGGYDIFSKKGSLDFLFGVVPGFTGSTALETFTFKFNAMPIRIRVNPDVEIHPLNTGVYFCYTFGKEYSSDLPGWYPDGYYWWSEAVRVNLFIGGDVRFVTHAFRKPKKFTAYYEIGTNEIKLVSYIQNKHALNIWNILHAGVGVRYMFKHQ